MAWVNRLAGLLGSRRGCEVEANIVVLGMAGSGKSTIMQQLKPPNVRMIYLDPMVPVPYETRAEKFDSRSLSFISFDLTCKQGVTNPWEDYYRHCHCVILVIDSTDRFIVDALKLQIDTLMANPLIKSRQMPILILASKMDISTSISSYQMADMLGLDQLITDRPWHIAPVDGLTGEGLHEGMDWLAHRLRVYCRRGSMPT